jgi:intracellular septation protein
MTDREQQAAPAAKKPEELSAGQRLALDFGPMLCFFGAYYLTSKNVYISTGIFMAATVIAMIFSRIKTGKISPMLLFSGVMVLGFGGLTIWLKDDSFIKIKPTIYYVMIAVILMFGLVTKRPTMQLVLGSAYPGLNQIGWDKLTRNWAGFFLIMAVLNEAVWRTQSTEFWLGFKLWGALPLTLIFAFANIPMLLKHGLETGADTPKTPPQG